MDYKELAEKRVKAGFSPTEISKAVGATYNTIWEWERGNYPKKLTAKFRRYLKLIGADDD